IRDGVLIFAAGDRADAVGVVGREFTVGRVVRSGGERSGDEGNRAGPSRPAATDQGRRGGEEDIGDTGSRRGAEIPAAEQNRSRRTTRVARKGHGRARTGIDGDQVELAGGGAAGSADGQ